MVHLKNIIKGILAGAVFFMAMQVGVAQEHQVSEGVFEKSTVEKSESTNSLEKLSKLSAPSSDWYFKGTNENQIFDADFWDTTPPSSGTCLSEATDLPCYYITPTEMDDADELVAYLETEHNNVESAVTLAAESRQDIPENQ